jgi:hypothetical protein
MNTRPHKPRTLGTALPTLVLAALAAALVLSATAVADPIITVPPINVGGTEVSGSADSDPQADVCVGDQHSGADPADSSALQLNDASCTSGGGTGSGAGTTGSGSGAGTTGSRPSGTAGSAGTGTAGRSTSTATTVAAADAVGLKIAAVRKLVKNVGVRRNFRLVVTVRDTRNLLVGGAIVSVGRVPGSRATISGLHAGFSNKRGLATILVPVTTRMFGKKLFVKIAARTPKARAVALRSLSLPRLR